MSFKRLRLHIKNEEGSGLVLALMTLLVLSVLGASLGAVTVGSFKLGDVNRDDTSAYYIAEAGANMAYEEFENGVNEAYSDFPDAEGLFYSLIEDRDNDNSVINKVETKLYDGFSDQFGDEPSVSISIEEQGGPNPKSYDIVSTGEVSGETRKVKKTVVVTWTSNIGGAPSFPENGALIGYDEVDIGKVTVDGDVYVHDLSKISKHNHTEIKGEEIEHSIDWNLYSDLLNNFPDFDDMESIEQPSYVTVPEGESKTIILDKLDFSENLQIEGNGTVNIYVKNDIVISNYDSFNTSGIYENVNIYYGGENNLNIKNHVNLNASLFIKEADLSVQPNATINGVLLTGGSVESKGNREGASFSYIIAPDSEVNIENHNVVNGFVLGKSINIGNNGEINYKSLSNFPFAVDKEGQTGESDLINSNPIIESD